MTPNDAELLHRRALQAERLIAGNLRETQQLVVLTAQATKPDSDTTEMNIHWRTEELIVSILANVHTLREISKTALRIHNRVETGDDTA